MQDIILGTLLGDASLTKSKTTYTLYVAHSEKQKNYLLWKASFFSKENNIRARVSGFGSNMNLFTYSNKSLLEPIYNITHVDGLKTVSQTWIDLCTERSLALWYQDDGTWGKTGRKSSTGERFGRAITFSTCGFDYNSQLLLIKLLNKFGISSKIHENKGYFYISTCMVSDFWNLIAPFVLIKSKVDLSTRLGVRKCKCGKLVAAPSTLCDECLWQIGVSTKVERHGALYHTLHGRFSTGSKLKLLKMGKPVHIEPTCYWFDHTLLNKEAK